MVKFIVLGNRVENSKFHKNEALAVLTEHLETQSRGSRGSYTENRHCVSSGKRQQRTLRSMADEWEAIARVSQLVSYVLSQVI